MIISSWNINSVRARIDNLKVYIKEKKPDILLLQETKTENISFPKKEIEKLGYSAIYHGQKSYNGVAIISKKPVSNVIFGLPSFKTDVQARYIECIIENIHISSLYLPNGNPINSEKFDYKLEWMEKLYEHARNLMKNDKDIILGGDWNIAPQNIDLFDEKIFENDAIYNIKCKKIYRKIENLGLIDAFRAKNPVAPDSYTYFDYQNNAWLNKNGIRIDHFLVSPWIADRINSIQIDEKERERNKPSDHVPIRLQIY